jgi:hypothetical protein
MIPTMSYTTTPALIQHVQGWDTRLREHPIIDWMFDYEEVLDSDELKQGGLAPWHADDFVYAKNGVTAEPGAASWAKLLNDYGPFSAHYHEPEFVVAYETATGGELMGVANIYANFVIPGEQTKTDLKGRTWELKSAAYFHFVWVKDATGPKGLKLQREEIIAGGLLMVNAMMQKGMVTWDQVAAQL